MSARFAAIAFLLLLVAGPALASGRDDRLSSPGARPVAGLEIGDVVCRIMTRGRRVSRDSHLP